MNTLPFKQVSHSVVTVGSMGFRDRFQACRAAWDGSMEHGPGGGRPTLRNAKSPSVVKVGLMGFPDRFKELSCRTGTVP